jgi:hypothetical protein
MKKIGLLAISLGALAVSASADTLNFHRTRDTAPVTNRSIPERPIHPAFAANMGFGTALEQVLSQRGGSVTDPSGKFAVQVSPDGMGQVIRLVPVNGGQAREWKIGSGAGDRVVSATIAELMTATGQDVPAQLASAVSVQPLKGQLKH